MSMEYDIEYMTQLTVALIAVGAESGLHFRAFQVPQGIWLNWSDDDSGHSGTAQITKDVTDGSHGSPQDAATTFTDYIVQLCDASQSY